MCVRTGEHWGSTQSLTSPLHQRSHPGSHIQPSLVCKDCDLREGEREREREGGGREGREREREKKPVVLFMAGDIID